MLCFLFFKRIFIVFRKVIILLKDKQTNTHLMDFQDNLGKWVQEGSRDDGMAVVSV